MVCQLLIPDCRSDECPDDVVAPVAPDASLPVIGAREGYHEIEPGNDYDELTAVPVGFELSISARPHLHVVEMPRETVLAFEVIVGKFFFTQTGCSWRNGHVW